MNISKFTQKSMEAVERCQKLAYEYGNQEIEEEHLLYSLLTIEDSLILKLIEKMGIQKEHFVNRVENAVSKRVKAVSYTHLDGGYVEKIVECADYQKMTRSFRRLTCGKHVYDSQNCG